MRRARKSDLTEHDVVHTYSVYYPSGRRFTLRGVYGMIGHDEGWAPTIRIADGSLFLLDARGVVARDGLIIFDPRRALRTLPAFAVRWLREHPEWPRIVTEAAP
jgi:hypothetical protein